MNVVVGMALLLDAAWAAAAARDAAAIHQAAAGAAGDGPADKTPLLPQSAAASTNVTTSQHRQARPHLLLSAALDARDASKAFLGALFGACFFSALTWLPCFVLDCVWLAAAPGWVDTSAGAINVVNNIVAAVFPFVMIQARPQLAHG